MTVDSAIKEKRQRAYMAAAALIDALDIKESISPGSLIRMVMDDPLQTKSAPSPTAIEPQAGWRDGYTAGIEAVIQRHLQDGFDKDAPWFQMMQEMKNGGHQ